MRGRFELPKFSVVVWVRKTDTYDAVREALLDTAAADPDESTEYQGMVDFHWGFDRPWEAEVFLDALQGFVTNPAVVVLRMISGDDAIPSRTLKDERHVRH